MDLKEVGLGGCGLSYFTKDVYKWQNLVHIVTDFQVQQNAGTFLTSAGMISFSRKTQLHVVSQLGSQCQSGEGLIPVTTKILWQLWDHYWITDGRPS